MPFDLQDCKKASYKNHPQSYLSTTEHGILFLAQDVTQIISSVSLDQAFSYSRKKWVVDIEDTVLPTQKQGLFNPHNLGQKACLI